ncbi:MAG: acetylxylan esterase [Planctomycetota bacterium]|nr:MAG: acetylxylan esterase [Planctomycetota bacterium]
MLDRLPKFPMRGSQTLAGMALLSLLFLASSARAQPLRDLDTHCPFHPPTTLDQWQGRAAQLRLQLRTALGLHPAPQLDAVQPHIYGRIDRGDYEIYKVTFESLPGMWVTGNLYRPVEIPSGQRVPGILCPHGHWTNGRFMVASDEEVQRQLASGAERFASAARNPIQARCVQLARMGCVVFHWDMIGYADSVQISYERAHRFAKQPRELERTDAGWLLFSPWAEMHAQSVMGLQTLATQRAIDMLLQLPEVDPQRIGITGASGGGTQTFIVAALDQRLALAFPAVMVSTGMQGGCTCENACSLRTGTGNVEIAGLIAPRPLGMTAADDWTRTMPQDGFPQLKQLYALCGHADRVELFPALHFKHNYNHVSRVAMYGFVNKHFNLGFESPVLERDFTFSHPEELTVWDPKHPQPEGGEAFERRLLRRWSEIADGQMRSMLRGDQPQVAALGQVLQDGWRVVLGTTTLPYADLEVHVERLADGGFEFTAGDLPAWRAMIAAQPLPDQADNAHFGNQPPADDDHSGVWQPWHRSAGDIHIDIRSPESTRRYYLALAGWRMQPVDSSDVGSSASPLLVQRMAWQPLVANPRLAAAYTFGYNRPLLADQALQIGLTLAWMAQEFPDAERTVGGNGVDALAAAAGLFCAQQRNADLRDQWTLECDFQGFTLSNVDHIRHRAFLPGGLRYWDWPGLLAALRDARIDLHGDDLPTAVRELERLYAARNVTIKGAAPAEDAEDAAEAPEEDAE